MDTLPASRKHRTGLHERWLWSPSSAVFHLVFSPWKPKTLRPLAPFQTPLHPLAKNAEAFAADCRITEGTGKGSLDAAADGAEMHLPERISSIRQKVCGGLSGIMY